LQEEKHHCETLMVILYNLLARGKTALTPLQESEIQQCLQLFLDIHQPIFVFHTVEILRLLSDKTKSIIIPTEVLMVWLDSFGTAAKSESNGSCYRQTVQGCVLSTFSILSCLTAVDFKKDQGCIVARWTNQRFELLNELVQSGNMYDPIACKGFLHKISNHECDSCDTSLAKQLLEEFTKAQSPESWAAELFAALQDIDKNMISEETLEQLETLKNSLKDMHYESHMDISDIILSENTLPSTMQVLKGCLEKTLSSDNFGGLVRMKQQLWSMLFYLTLPEDTELRANIVEERILETAAEELHRLLDKVTSSPVSKVYFYIS
jgi:hypothetical protein